MNPVELLKQPWSATIALFLCMWAQIPHSRTVFEHWAKEQSGAAFAWGFEAAVLMFVVRNMHVASWVFALLSALMNVGYYSLQEVDMWSGVNGDNWLCWLLAVVLPFTIAMYSHVLAHVQRMSFELPAWVHVAWAKAQSAIQGDTRHETRDTDMQPVSPAVQPELQVDAPAVATIVAEQPDVVASRIFESDDVLEPVGTESQVDTQLIEIDSTLPSQLDEMNQRILDSIGAGNYTPYAISKDTGIAVTTLKRKVNDKVVGRIPQLVAMGKIHNSSGVDGKEYRLAS